MITVELPENAIIFVRDGEPRPPQPKDYYLDNTYGSLYKCMDGPRSDQQIFRRYSPAEFAEFAEFAELSKPKLPPDKSVWRTRSEHVFECRVWHDAVHGLAITLSQTGTEGYAERFDSAADFARWVRETGAVCVYDPSKEPCQHERIEYTPDPSGNNDVLWKCPDCKREWGRDPRRKPDAK